MGGGGACVGDRIWMCQLKITWSDKSIYFGMVIIVTCEVSSELQGQRRNQINHVVARTCLAPSTFGSA
jgi:hypothetical protein